MNKSFTVNLAIIILINLLIKPFYIFGIDVTVQNTIGPDNYGFYFVLLNFTYLFQIINDFGIQIFNTRLVSRQPGIILNYLGVFLRMKGILALVFLGALFGTGWLLGYAESGYLLLLIALNQILVSVILYLRTNVAAIGLYRTDSFLSALDKLLMILICGYLLWIRSSGPAFDILDFIYAQLFSLALTAVITLFIVLRKAPATQATDKQIRLTVDFVRQAWPFALAIFLMTIYTRIDGVMLEQLLADGSYQAGLYAAGYRLLDAVNMIAFLFTPLLLPMFVKLGSDRDALRSLLRTAFEIMFVLCVCTAFLGVFFRQEIMDLLYTEANDFWGKVFGLLILSFIPIGMMYVFGTLQTSLFSIKRLNILYLGCVMANVVLNFLLIPQFQAAGAAAATLATQALVAIALIIFTVNDLQLRWNFRYLARCAGIVILGGPVIYALKNLSGLTPILSFLAALLILIILVSVLGFLTPAKLAGFLKEALKKRSEQA